MKGMETQMNKPEPAPLHELERHIPFPDSGSYPPREGNKVRPLIDGLATFRRICQAVEAARHSVWVTVAFASPAFRMPDEYGTFFDILDRAVERGLDVRVIFWRPNPETERYGQTFSGTPADRELLRSRGSRLRARWDRADTTFCQHQKSWLVDAGQPSETAFVGGINLTSGNLGSPDHEGDGQRHDAYVEITGPSATDVHHNFVQRWNEASERHATDGTWGDCSEEDLPFPTRISDRQGASLVQIQRNIHPGRYSDGRASPGGAAYSVADGEQTILEQYKQAIDAARSTIYIENQALPVPEIAIGLDRALRRGLDVVVLVPATPEDNVKRARHDPARQDFFDRIEALGQYENFTLVGIAGRNAEGERCSVYVHGKIMLVDDAWATIGSCNLHRHSLFGHSEMNASFWDPDAVRTLRCELLSEHLCEDTTQLDDRAALQLYRDIAQKNRRKKAACDADWQGLAFSLDPTAYGRESP